MLGTIITQDFDTKRVCAEQSETRSSNLDLSNNFRVQSEKDHRSVRESDVRASTCTNAVSVSRRGAPASYGGLVERGAPISLPGDLPWLPWLEMGLLYLYLSGPVKLKSLRPIYRVTVSFKSMVGTNDCREKSRSQRISFPPIHA